MTASRHVERLPPPRQAAPSAGDPPTAGLFGTTQHDGTTHRDGTAGRSPGGADGWHDLAPDILRQRLVIEGVPAAPISAAAIMDYLSALARVTDMVQLIEPVTHCSDQYGWAGWVHWETSGAHFYAWERPRLFFSVDIYTCKAFDVDTTVAFTRDFFHAGPVVAKPF